MAVSWLVTILVASAAAVFVAVIPRKTSWFVSKGRSLPPGPPSGSCWFWDNAMPKVNIGATFHEWANLYGPVFTLRKGCEIVVVVARVDAAVDIMEKEGSALADRPPMIAADELLSGGKRITLTRSGERFRRLRKAAHTHLQAKAVETYKDTQFDQARTLVLDVLDNPKDLGELTHRFSTSVILRVTYGKLGAVSLNDPDFIGIKQAVAHFIEGMRPNAYLADHFPWLKYVPGYGRRLKNYYEVDLKFYRGQLERVKQQMSADNAHSSFTKTLLENIHNHHLSYDEMAFLAGTLFEAGSDTSAIGICVMIMAAACFPDTQRRVQEELDTVVGTDRLPDWNDWHALPQLHAFISEALRWRPITPLGFAHRSTRNITWKDYCIPAGTTVIGNHWAISRDPIAFPDPEKFDPQRWFDKDGQLRTDIDCFPFGFGRRVCPGMLLANRSLFIAIALLLWSFRIVQRPDAPVNMTPDMDNIVARSPAYEVEFVPRLREARLKEMMMAL